MGTTILGEFGRFAEASPPVKSPHIKQTPSALKWLAEKRARLANDLEQTRKIASELTQKADALQSDLAALDRSLRLGFSHQSALRRCSATNGTL